MNSLIVFSQKLLICHLRGIETPLQYILSYSVQSELLTQSTKSRSYLASWDVVLVNIVCSVKVN